MQRVNVPIVCRDGHFARRASSPAPTKMARWHRIGGWRVVLREGSHFELDLAIGVSIREPVPIKYPRPFSGTERVGVDALEKFSVSNSAGTGQATDSPILRNASDRDSDIAITVARLAPAAFAFANDV
jgi:hypothetical protein